MRAQRATCSLFQSTLKRLMVYATVKLLNNAEKSRLTFAMSVQFKCGNNTNELFKTAWFTGWRRGTLNTRHLFNVVNIFRAICLIFLRLPHPSTATLSDLSSIWITSGCLSSSWENGHSCVSLLYAIWHNQHGWNYYMSISHANACFSTSQTETFSQCKKLVNASALSMALRLEE